MGRLVFVDGDIIKHCDNSEEDIYRNPGARIVKD